MSKKKSGVLYKKNQHKIIKQKQKQKKKVKQCIIKNEIDILNKINKLPHELIDYIYSFVDKNIKYKLSHYFDLYKKYIVNYNLKKLQCIYKDYNRYEYCTYDKISHPLQYMLKQIPIDKLQKYIYIGTPEKYFNIAFPDEGHIWEYLYLNYKLNKPYEEKRKDYMFEIIDLLSYFTTRTNEFLQLYKNDESIEYDKFKTNEVIVKKIVLSIIYIYNKYAHCKSDIISN
jgi:hypothetical protein